MLLNSRQHFKIEFAQPLQKSCNLYLCYPSSLWVTSCSFEECIEFEEANACSAVEAIKKFSQYYEAQDFEVGFCSSARKSAR